MLIAAGCFVLLMVVIGVAIAAFVPEDNSSGGYSTRDAVSVDCGVPKDSVLVDVNQIDVFVTPKGEAYITGPPDRTVVCPDGSTHPVQAP